MATSCPGAIAQTKKRTPHPGERPWFGKLQSRLEYKLGSLGEAWQQAD